MADAATDPLVALIRERGILDDTQLDEVVQEFCSRSAERKRDLISFLSYPLMVMEPDLGTSIGDSLDKIHDFCTEYFASSVLQQDCSAALEELRGHNMVLLKVMFQGHMSYSRL